MKKVFTLSVCLILVLLVACSDVSDTTSSSISASSSASSEPASQSADSSFETDETGRLGFIEVATIVQLEVEEQTGEKVTFSFDEDDWIIDGNGLYYSTKTDLDVGGTPTTVVYHFEFTDDTHSSWNVIWLNIGGEDVVDNR